MHQYACRGHNCIYQLARFILFNGYFYVSVDIASAPGEVCCVDLIMDEPMIYLRKSMSDTVYMHNVSNGLVSSCYVFDGLLSSTGERHHYEHGFNLRITHKDGFVSEIMGATLLRTYPDQYHSPINALWQILNGFPDGGRIMELGARGASSESFRMRLPKNWNYIGVDIKSGNNVDLVCDAHFLSQFADPESIDVIYSSSVFEHLAAPWKVAIEAGKMLKPSGYIFTATHNAWPQHEAPWDYWRFTKFSWSSLFNSKTGFRIVDRSLVETAKIVPVVMTGPDRSRLPAANGVWTGTACLAQKIGEPSAEWSGYVRDETMYPG